VRLIWLRSGVGEQLGRWDVRDYEIISGNLICTNAPSPLYARYQYEAPVALYPHHFIEFLVAALVEELAAVFGHNLNTQSVFHRRIYDSNGALGQAIQEERRQNPPQVFHVQSRLALERSW
jgi:hypothetical protein